MGGTEMTPPKIVYQENEQTKMDDTLNFSPKENISYKFKKKASVSDIEIPDDNKEAITTPIKPPVKNHIQNQKQVAPSPQKPEINTNLNSNTKKNNYLMASMAMGNSKSAININNKNTPKN